MRQALSYLVLFMILLGLGHTFAEAELECDSNKVKVIIVNGGATCAPESVAKSWVRTGFAIMASDVVKEAKVEFSEANVPATLPLHKGYYEGDEVYFIITDASEQKHVDVITKKQGWRVELAPLLANAPEEALSRTYMFTNGVEGGGIHGSQGEVFTSTPAQPEVYSALTAHVHVTWFDEATPRELTSEQEILDAEAAGELLLTDLPVVINMPHIVWPEGQMLVRDDKEITDDMPYVGGQIVDINLEEMTVTFVAHRGWGPNGETIYYIVTDATPTPAADMMGVVDTPTSANLIANSAAVDLFQFGNGIEGTGPMGFQAGIGAANIGDENYSPMWRIFMVSWNNPDEASMLKSTTEISELAAQDTLEVNLARPANADHVVNCPFIDPFQ